MTHSLLLNLRLVHIFFLTFISKVILYVAQQGVGVTLKVQKI